jgi:hypothetical protein
MDLPSLLSNPGENKSGLPQKGLSMIHLECRFLEWFPLAALRHFKAPAEGDDDVRSRGRAGGYS